MSRIKVDLLVFLVQQNLAQEKSTIIQLKIRLKLLTKKIKQDR